MLGSEPLDKSETEEVNQLEGYSQDSPLFMLGSEETPGSAQLRTKFVTEGFGALSMIKIEHRPAD